MTSATHNAFRKPVRFWRRAIRLALGCLPLAQPAPAEELTVALPDGGGLALARIEAGTFTMGAGADDPHRLPDEGPPHTVTLTHDFWLGKFEVTQEQFASLMGYNPSSLRNGQAGLPVEQVSWEMAVAFCGRLTDWARGRGQLPDGHVFTLPTEAQWEYACSTGLAGRAAGNGNSMTLADRAWTRSNAWYRPHPAGTKAADAHGLHDLLGNVWEWCLDWKDRYPSRAQTDPRGPSSGIFRVVRGGCFLLDERHARAASRGGVPKDAMWKNIGFRVALVRAP